MELTELKNKIINSFDGSKNDLADILAMIDKDEAIFPFNEYENLIGNIRSKISIKDFNRLRIGVSNPGCADHVKRHNRRHAPHAQRSRKTIHRLNSGIDEFAKRTHKPAG